MRKRNSLQILILCVILILDLENSNQARSVNLLNRGVSSQVYASCLAFYRPGEFMESWKDIKGYEGSYQVSDLGNIVSVVRRKMLVPQANLRGYLHVTLCKNNTKKTKVVHRLVAEAYIPNPHNYPCINHKKCIKKDNRATQLEWCTYKMNSQHASKMGRMKPNSGCFKKGCKPNATSFKKGIKPFITKLKELEVVEIKQRIAKGERNIDIAKVYSVTASTISSIKCGTSWSHIKVKAY